ncbi:hypothetical protein AGDE_14767 [Angomonas deanei]|uniref:Uncharacterized protein n=1 Tax=Angomonas deanei TaxID=59799 RepID=A0A7G2C506_9TRYP|nr:hypothetical protein AGDE_14767 [Angomonas deanei]CAD2214575.1 hypothetical protein, conserved [Angomonas deanei]|eukprot:EPY20275.1 hypothetical protein AGDE_14767 [Angomonas deanei]
MCVGVRIRTTLRATVIPLSLVGPPVMIVMMRPWGIAAGIRAEPVMIIALIIITVMTVGMVVVVIIIVIIIIVVGSAGVIFGWSSMIVTTIVAARLIGWWRWVVTHDLLFSFSSLNIKLDFFFFVCGSVITNSSCSVVY